MNSRLPARTRAIATLTRSRASLAAIAAIVGAYAGPAASQTTPEIPPAGLIKSTGSMIQTDGMLTPRAMRRLRRATMPRATRVRTAEPDAGVWLIEYMTYLLDTEPAVARRPRVVARASVVTVAVPRGAPRPDTPVPPVRLTATPTPDLIPPQAAPPTSPITTGAVVPGRPDAARNRAEANDALIIAAERFQARADLVKLEFAARTYDERKLSGQQVFELRNDWRVLERARDALSGAELASAVASGFEANAYINETTRTIVVAVAGSQELRRDFLAADVWQALIKSQAPQQFYMAKTYVRSVIQRYQTQGFSTECIGHSLGGGACAYAAAELGIRALVLNPISAGKLAAGARYLVTNYVVDGDIANLVYGARGNEFPGNVQVISDGRDAIRLLALEKYGQLAGPILVVRELRASINSHKVDTALDLIAVQAEISRPR